MRGTSHARAIYYAYVRLEAPGRNRIKNCMERSVKSGAYYFQIAGPETIYFLLEMESIEGSLKAISTEGKLMSISAYKYSNRFINIIFACRRSRLITWHSI